MQFFGEMHKRVQHLIKENASTLLTAGGVVGTVTTAVLAGRAGFKAAVILEEHTHERVMADIDPDTSYEQALHHLDPLSKTDAVKLVGVHFLPPTLTCSATVASIIMANRMSAQKAAALAAAYGLAEGRLNEYKEKVAEKLSPTKNQQLEDELAQDQVDKTPGANQIIVVDGEVLCFDQPTGRYFRSTMENINKAVNATNAEILHHDYASATYFYEELGMPATTWTDDVGWNTDHLLDLKISTVMSEDNRPCIALDFKVLPKMDFIPKHY